MRELTPFSHTLGTQKKRRSLLALLFRPVMRNVRVYWSQLENMAEIKYLFRKPKYPVLIETDLRVFGVRNGQKIEKLRKKELFAKKDSYTLIDSTGEGWMFMPEESIISPFSMNKQWTKLKISEFLNATLANLGISERFKAGSLSNKRLDKIINDIVEFEGEL